MSTSILIRRLTGTGKGKEETLLTQEVSLGAGPHNTVRFDPTWDRGVAAAHARIYRDESGAWWLVDAGSSTGTFINGQRITMKRPVGGTFVLELGQGGPKVEINLPGEMPRGAAAPGVRPGVARTASGGGMKWLALAACVTLLGAGAWFMSGKGGSINVKIGSGDSDESIRLAAKKYEQALGLVVVPGEKGAQGFGTAWAFGPSMFATNAHIALPVMGMLEEGKDVFVITNKAPDRKYKVLKAVAHPSFLSRHLNMDGKPPAASPYDVGILWVDGDPPVKLPVASQEKLRSLDSGHRVAFLGFPMENLNAGNVDVHYPVATMQSGIITSVTDPWLGEAVPEKAILIRHNLPSAGGASGSPLFDVDGEVVGVHSAGNYTMGIHADTGYELRAEAREKAKELQQQFIPKLQAPGLSDKEKQKIIASYSRELIATTGISALNLTRVTSASLINFAQRADLLQELLESTKQ
jgi:hypothetical protein